MPQDRGGASGMQVQIWQVNVSCLFPFVSATGWTDQNSQAQRDTPHRRSLQSAPRPGRLTSEHFQRHVRMIHHPIQAATQQQSHQSVVTRFAPCLLTLRHVAICLKGFPTQVVLVWSMCADVMGLKAKTFTYYDRNKIIWVTYPMFQRHVFQQMRGQ